MLDPQIKSCTERVPQNSNGKMLLPRVTALGGNEDLRVEPLQMRVVSLEKRLRTPSPYPASANVRTEETWQFATWKRTPPSLLMLALSSWPLQPAEL